MRFKGFKFLDIKIKTLKLRYWKMDSDDIYRWYTLITLNLL